VQYVQSLPNLAQSESDVIYPHPDDAAIPELPIFFDGLPCPWEDQDFRYICRTKFGRKKHCAREHQWVNQQRRGGDVRSKHRQAINKSWKCNQACQRFFKTGSWQRYFAVATIGSGPARSVNAELQDSFFRQQEDDIHRSAQDASDAANQVRGFEDHSSSVVPWHGPLESSIMSAG